MTIRLKAAPFNITVIQVYAPTADHEEDEIDDFYNQLQSTIDKVNKKDILIIQGDWNAKVGRDAQVDWKRFCGPSCNAATNDRGLRLLEFASYNDVVLANTLGRHKASRRRTWHAPNGIHHNQIDYILVQSRFRSCINQAKTRTFPGADIGSDHDLVLMNFRVRLKKRIKKGNIRIKFNLDRLKDPTIVEAFQATIGGRFEPLLALEDNVESLTTSFNTAMMETATHLLGKHRRKTKPWITNEILDMCDRRRNLKKIKNTTGAHEYRIVNKTIRSDMKKAKVGWIEKQCTDIEKSLAKNNSKRAYQIVKELTQKKQARVRNIQDKEGNCLTEEKAIADRWTEYCSELYNHQVQGDPILVATQNSTNEDNFPILREEVEVAIKSLKKGKAAGVDNIPAELIQHGGEAVTNLLRVYAIRSGGPENGLRHGPNPSSLLSLRKATCSSAKTTGR